MPKTKPSASRYVTKDFYGTVVTKDWIQDLTGHNAQRVTGLCTLVQDEEIAGFRTRGTESNWGMRVVGQRQQWTILGCQIRAVIAHAPDDPQNGDNQIVVP